MKIFLSQLIGAFVLNVFINSQAFATDLETFQCAIYEDGSAPLISGIPANHSIDKSKYVDAIAPKSVLVDVRRVDASNQALPVTINGALKMALNQLKVKSYLKDKQLVLIGDGLDDYFLEKEIEKLTTLGFSNVKILEYGIVSLIGTGQLQGNIVSSLYLRTSNSERLVAASLGADSNYLFLNIGEASDVYEKLGLDSVHVPFDNTDDFYTKLYAEAMKGFEKDVSSRVVLVHDDSKIYGQLSGSDKMFDMLGLWFMDGGNQGLVKLQEKLAILSKEKSRNQIVCAS